MNKVYKVIWNSRLCCWQVVSEIAKSHTSNSQVDGVKSDSGSSVVNTMSAILLFTMALLPLSVQAAIKNNELPTGAQVNSGSASFTQANNALNINQNSQNLSTNWNTFNIGKDATVNFNQPNQSSVAINHVSDSNTSQIMGRLNANGQVFLLNPNGVVFSQTAQVNVGGIVASTLKLSDSDIQNGKYLLKGDSNSNATIENHGSINTLSGGTVALIAPNVINTGAIKTPNGITHLTSASQVTLALQDGSLTQYQVDQGVLQGLVDNGGAIIADNGAVYLTAKAKDRLSKAVVNHSGIIEANRLTQNAKGEIILLGDMQAGKTLVSGILKAEGKNGQNGGFIETSAASVKIKEGAKVSTLSDTAKTGTWLIDPTDFTISAGNTSQTTSGMGASTLQNNLSNNNVTLRTVSTGSGKGDINVNASVSWNAATELTLNAHNDININADITATNDNGKLNLIYGQNTANTNADYHLNNAAKVNLKAGQNFSTKKGSDAPKIYQVITSLGNAGSTTGTDLQGINGNLSGNYVLGSDIDAAATADWNTYTGFDPIGYHNVNYPVSGSPSIPFKGLFDGLGHEISSLSISSGENGIGLFAETGSNSEIRNVGLKSINYSSYQRAGGLVAKNYGLIKNSYVTGNMQTFENDFGGLVGWNDTNAKISGSFADVDITSRWGQSRNVGGLVGVNQGTVENSYALGNVIGQNTLGGLVGTNEQGVIKNSYSTGKVELSGKGIQHSVGGLTGFSQGTIQDSFWNTDTSGMSTSAGGNAKTTADLKKLSTFEGWDIDTAGATGKVWRIYEDQSAPLLRQFLKPVVSEVSTNFADKVYNGAITSGTLVSPGFSYKTISKNAGVYSLVDGSIIVMGDPAADNMTQFGKDIIYTAVSGPSFFTVNKKALTVTGMNAVNKTYDGSTAATLSGGMLNGLVGSETLGVTGLSSSFSDKNAGTAKTVTVIGATLVDGSGLASNYNISNPTGLTANITKKALTVTGMNAVNKTYDGSTAATLSGGMLNGLVGSETLGVTGLSSSFSDKNAGTAKTVTVIGATLVDGSGLASNYSISNPTGLTANITKKAATVTANSANKTYNGQQQSVTGFTATGLVNGETESALTQVSASGSGTNAGSYTSSASGTDNNYDLSFVDGSLDIGKAQISQVNGITANNRLFDGTTQATLNTNSAEFDGVFGTDQLVVSTAQGQFEDPQVGSNKTVNITGLSLSGADAANYELTNTTATTRADIYALTPTPNPTPSIRLTTDYEQAIQFRREQQPTVTADLGTIGLVEIINGGVNLTGLNTLTGVR